MSSTVPPQSGHVRGSGTSYGSSIPGGCADPLAPVGRSRLSSGATWMYRARPFRERCGLAEAGAPGGLEFRAQPLVFAAQSLPVALELLQFRAQSDYSSA